MAKPPRDPTDDDYKCNKLDDSEPHSNMGCAFLLIVVFLAVIAVWAIIAQWEHTTNYNKRTPKCTCYCQESGV